MQEDPPAGVPEWVVTYGDMMSLLLTFFIMLVSMSELKDDGKNRAAMNALQERFGPTTGDGGMVGRSFSETSFQKHSISHGNRSQMGTEKGNAGEGGPDGPNSPGERINHGEVVTTGGSITFDQFDTALDDEAKLVLDRLVTAVRSKPHRLIVRGHAFAEPVKRKPQFRNQHDLSFARAHSVAKYLIAGDIDPRRILVSAAGDGEPRVLSRTMDERRLNRRVDVFTVESYVSPSEAGSENQ